MRRRRLRPPWSRPPPGRPRQQCGRLPWRWREGGAVAAAASRPAPAPTWADPHATVVVAPPAVAAAALLGDGAADFVVHRRGRGGPFLGRHRGAATPPRPCGSPTPGIARPSIPTVRMWRAWVARPPEVGAIATHVPPLRWACCGGLPRVPLMAGVVTAVAFFFFLCGGRGAGVPAAAASVGMHGRTAGSVRRPPRAIVFVCLSQRAGGRRTRPPAPSPFPDSADAVVAAGVGQLLRAATAADGATPRRHAGASTTAPSALGGATRRAAGSANADVTTTAGATTTAAAPATASTAVVRWRRASRSAC